MEVYKSDVFAKFKDHECMIANKFNKPLQIVRSDGGREYISHSMEEYKKSLGIKHEKSTPATQAQNGRIERENRTIIECATTMMIRKNVTKKLWGEAVNCAVFLLNRVLPPTSNKDKTPYELWVGRKPNVSKLRIFGSPAYKLILNQYTKKLDNRSEPVTFVGYEGDSNNYRVYSQAKNTVSVSKYVTFNENSISSANDQKVSEENDIWTTFPVSGQSVAPVNAPVNMMSMALLSMTNSTIQLFLMHLRTPMTLV